MATESWRYFSENSELRDGSRHAVPAVARRQELEQDPSGYFVPQALADAVDVAIALGQPLLLTGEPGTGKTQVAHHIAWKLFGDQAEAIVFNTKTTSTARDLFYHYDSIRHFRDAQLSKQGNDSDDISQRTKGLDVQDYITFQGLGRAILMANAKAEVRTLLPQDLREQPARQSVVLIDEIDKAPRDLPNDVLNEVERMRFDVKETGASFKADEKFRPIVILTSNSERVLPDPFLRRCVFHHLEFPKTTELKLIIKQRLGMDEMRPDKTQQWIAEAIDQFEKHRTLLNRKPATAELLAWLRFLEQIQKSTQTENPLKHPNARAGLGIIAKNKEDRARLTAT
ncbi:MAG: AAA family ATPase [Phycisphaerae bacterium]|nr:AAA family ATPase [Gemmatimonadaceae bacterium]